MNPVDVLSAVVDRPEFLSGGERPEGVDRTGLIGYVAGTLGFFVFLRMFSAVPPGAISFVMVLGFVLAANLLFAAVMHIFMELTGIQGSAARLFLAFGYSDFFLTLLVPFGFFAKLGYLNVFMCVCLCLGLVIYTRVRLVRRLYQVSVNKALLSVWLPYAGFTALFFFASIYALAWLIWLLV